MVLSDVRRIARRAKESERTLGRWLLLHDGPDPRMKGIASSTGRVGHITQLQFDVVSRTYAAENKNMKVPARLWLFWCKIIDVATGQGKEPMLRIEPTNAPLGLRKRYPSLHIITEDRHAELLEKERAYDKALEGRG